MRAFWISISLAACCATIGSDIAAGADVSSALTQADVAALPTRLTNYTSFKKLYIDTHGKDSRSGRSASTALRTLRRALSKAKSKTIIYLRSGTYRTSRLDVHKSNLVILGVGKTAPLIVPSSTGSDWDSSIAFQISGAISNVILERLTVRGFKGSALVYGHPGTQRNIQLRKITVQSSPDPIVNDYPGHSGYLVDGFFLDDISITGASSIGITCGDETSPCAKNVYLSNVRVQGDSPDGEDSGADGIAFVNSDNILVVGAQVRLSSGDGMDFKATRVSVVNSTIENVGRNGLKFWHGGEAINTIIDNTGADAAIVTSDGNNRLVNCAVTRHNFRSGGVAAYVMTVAYDLPAPAGTVQIINTIFHDQPGPIYVNASMGLEIRNSIFSKFINDNAFLEIGGVTYNSAAAVGAAGFGTSLITADPVFRDLGRLDFRLSPPSPGINAGYGQGRVPAFDRLNAIRPQSGAVDIGPYEQ